MLFRHCCAHTPAVTTSCAFALEILVEESPYSPGLCLEKRHRREGSSALLNRLNLHLGLGTTGPEWIQAAGPEKAQTAYCRLTVARGQRERKASMACLSCCHQGAAELHQWVLASARGPSDEAASYYGALGATLGLWGEAGILA